MPKCVNCGDKFEERVDKKCPACGTLITKTGKPIPLCPYCENPVYKRDKGKCMSCGNDIIMKRQKVGNLNVTTYEKSNVAEVVEERDELPPWAGKRVYREQKGDKHWSIVYNVMVDNVICGNPECRTKLFEVRMLNGKMSEKCHKCKHTTDYTFNILRKNLVSSRG